MNDLREKNEEEQDGKETKKESTSKASHLYYKKLEAYLSLLYQAYLKKETLLEPEIKAAIWRMVQFREDFPLKIRMLQLELLGYETDDFDGEWHEIKDSLFPIKDFEFQDMANADRKKQIEKYNEAVLALLKSRN